MNNIGVVVEAHVHGEHTYNQESARFVGEASDYPAQALGE